MMHGCGAGNRAIAAFVESSRIDEFNKAAGKFLNDHGCDWLWKRKRLSGNQGVGKRSWD